MSNYNTQLQSNNTDLQQVLQALQSKAAGGGQAVPEISVDTKGLITATAGTKSSTYQLAFQAAKTITPGTVSQIAVSSGYYTGGNVTVAGDSNLVAGNIKSGVSIFGVSGTLEEGSIEGVEVEYSENEDAIISGTIVNYTNDRVSVVSSAAFLRRDSLKTVNFPKCTNIGSNAFEYCGKLNYISFPLCERIGSEAFKNCGSLTSINFPACIEIGQSGFQYCNSLVTANFPVCTSGGGMTFEGCRFLVDADFPVCTKIELRMFSNCNNLMNANFPVCSSIDGGAFFNCYKLAIVDFPKCVKIEGRAFENCYRLSHLQLGASSVCTLFFSSVFSSTPFTGYSSYFSGTPYIYVPSSLITAYQSATNWTYFSSYFSAIESLEE